MDPDLMPLRQMAMYTAPAYDTLLRLDEEESVQPMLATDWESGSDDQGPFLDLTLREGLEFDDGTPFTSATVAANVKRSQELEGSTNAGVLAGVSVEEVDETHVRLRDERGVGPLPRLLAGQAGMMISDQAIADKVDLTEAEAGIGAFDLESVQPNRVVYTANDDYWDEDAAAVETLEITYLADDAKLNAVRAGDVDITILPEEMTKAAEDAGYSVEHAFSAENYTFSVNTAMKPFDDPRVREALNIAIDREAICDGVLDGACEPTGQIFGAGTKVYDADLGLENFSFDLDRAKSLISEAGATGARVEIATVAGNQIFEQLATVFQHQLEQIGLEVVVKPVAPPEVVSGFAVQKSVGIAFGATGNAFDPSESLDRYVMPTGLYNPGGHELTEIVELADQARLETDQEKRIEIYQELSGSLDTGSFIVPVASPETAYVIADHVEGWKSPWAPSFPSFRGVTG
ncbi:ABC transporter substrate-binding protein [Nocardioides pantholopis]|uniref:ABC transporter substrate-binding protein n=1 Tax=Nocardioides pantholopis TaxID=2483798 RepID=UPI0013DE5CC0|nr:ABC transporter substrate-binding protein [Nocardioides pantholopis]